MASLYYVNDGDGWGMDTVARLGRSIQVPIQLESPIRLGAIQVAWHRKSIEHSTLRQVPLSPIWTESSHSAQNVYEANRSVGRALGG